MSPVKFLAWGRQVKEETMEDIESLRGELRQLEELAKTPAFLKIVSVLQAEIDSMQNEIVLKPCASEGEVLLQEYRKGQVEGRMALSRLVGDRLETLEYEIKQRKDLNDEF